MSYKLSIVKNKMMKRIINILILLCCIASLSSCGNSTEERSRVLKIYNWADYIDEDVLAEFPDWYKQQTGEDLRIIYQVFDINEIMLTKIERGHEDFDVVCPRSTSSNACFAKTSCYPSTATSVTRRTTSPTCRPTFATS